MVDTSKADIDGLRRKFPRYIFTRPGPRPNSLLPLAQIEASRGNRKVNLKQVTGASVY